MGDDSLYVPPLKTPDMAGGFSMMFCIMGILYAWGVIQAELVRQQIASTVAISAIGALSAWSVAIGCLPVSGPYRIPDGQAPRGSCRAETVRLPGSSAASDRARQRSAASPSSPFP